MSGGSDIWLGDLARAVAAVGGTDPETVRAVAELLGLAPNAATSAAVRSEAPNELHPTPLPPVSGISPGVGAPTSVRSHDRDTNSPGTVTSSSDGPQLLTPLSRERRSPVAWTTPSLPTVARNVSPPPRQSLLAPRSATAIIQAAVSLRGGDGDLDIERAVDRLAKGLPLRTLPRHPTPTLVFGVQVLVDRGSGMQLFHRDQDDLVARIRNTVGHDATEVLHFEGSPLDGAGTEAGWTWDEYVPPAPGARVVILTDLGLGGPPHLRRGGRAKWDSFFDRLAQAHCTPVVFLPYPRHRWPAWAADRVRMVTWDRGTTVGWVRMNERRGVRRDAQATDPIRPTALVSPS